MKTSRKSKHIVLMIAMIATFPLFIYTVFDYHNHTYAREKNPSYEIHLTKGIHIRGHDITVIKSDEEPDKQKLGAWIVIKPIDKRLGSKIEIPILVIKCIIKHSKERRSEYCV